MKVAFFSTKPYDERSMTGANRAGHELVYFEPRLGAPTAKLAEGFPAVCAFVNDVLDKATLEILHRGGTRCIALRCAGYNNVDLKTAASLGIQVLRVPAYSPYAVAEHAVALILTLNRKTHKAYQRVREGNFSLDGLLGRDLHGKTVGVIGTGKIGCIFAGIMQGFGCRVLAYDLFPNQELAASGVEYAALETLLRSSDIISLHCPLNEQTQHLLNDRTIELMKDGVAVINTSRGALIDAQAAIRGLKRGKIGYLGLDVYEEESSLFFEDLSHKVIKDDTFMRLTTFPNVLITGHQAFFTREALENIAETTLSNLSDFEAGRSCPNAVK